MVSQNYAKAYTEILEIIKYFPKEDYNKIPTEKIDFYEKNKDIDYNFQINPDIDLSFQNISKEANAIITNLYIEYFATKDEKQKIDDILYFNFKENENEKEIKYDPKNIFLKEKKTIENDDIDKNGLCINNESTVNNQELVEYKENFFIKFKNWIIKLLKSNKD